MITSDRGHLSKLCAKIESSKPASIRYVSKYLKNW